MLEKGFLTQAVYSYRQGWLTKGVETAWDKPPEALAERVRQGPPQA